MHLILDELFELRELRSAWKAVEGGCDAGVSCWSEGRVKGDAGEWKAVEGSRKHLLGLQQMVVDPAHAREIAGRGVCVR